MEWLEAHWKDILAVLGALYIAARGIVALTPTPKDDEVLGKVTAAVKRLAAILGLDFNQGLKK